MTESVGVIGLGIMGGAFAGNLVEAGFAVTGFDPVAEKCDALAAKGGRALGSAGAVTAESDVTILSLPSVAALDDVVASVVAGGATGTVLVECSTLPIADKERARDALAEQGIALLDCPISGTGSQATRKELVVFASGDRAAYETSRPVIAGFAGAQRYIGPFGDGSRLKFVANTLIALHIVAAAEAMALSARAGLDLDLVHDVLSPSPAGSAMFELRGRLMKDGLFEPAQMKLSLWQKDMDIIGRFARETGAELPLFTAVAPLYAAAAADNPEADTAAVYKVVAKGILKNRGR